MSEIGRRSRLLGAIFDVDGVLVASPHERAWREALAGYADPARFTTEFYQAHVAGKPRLDGARATLEGLGVPAAAARTPEYARKKQALIDRLIAEGSFEAFPDAVRFASALHVAGLRLALASSSRNVAAMHASWLNQVEVWFSILSSHALTGASFTSPRQVREQIDAFIAPYNQDAHPFEWTKQVVFSQHPRSTYANLRN